MNTGEDTFQIYVNFKAQFLKQFTDSNSLRIMIERLMSMKQGKQLIQKYCIKTLNLVRQINLRDQAAKALIFRRFYLKNQKRVMMANFLKSKKELVQKILKEYLSRVERLLRCKKI